MRILLDTNVVLDFLLRRPEGFANADQIFFHLQNRELSEAETRPLGSVSTAFVNTT